MQQREAYDRTDRPGGPSKKERREASVSQRLLAEFLGAFFLTFVAAGAEIVATTTDEGAGNTARYVAPGLVVMALVYSLGDISGAHFNPVVTLAFALRGVFRWVHVPVYWAAQFGGACVAALTLRQMFGNIAHLGAPNSRMSAGTILTLEGLLTGLLILVILNTATRERVIGPNAAIAVGATIILCGIVFGPVTGAVMNPARAFGPALVSGHWTHSGAYGMGAVVGSIGAVAITAIIHPVKTPAEVDAAEGERR